MPPSAERGAGAVCGNRAARAGRSRMGRGGRRTRGVERGLAAALARTAVSRGLNSELPAGDRATGPVPQRVGAQDPVGEPCADSRGQRRPRSAPSPLGGPRDGAPSKAPPRLPTWRQTLGPAGNLHSTSLAVGNWDLSPGGRSGEDRPIREVASGGGEPDVSGREGRRAAGVMGGRGREGPRRHS